MPTLGKQRPEVYLRCLGVGEGWPCPDRRHSSFLYQIGTANLLIDCGDGASTAYKASGLSYHAIDSVFLSHMHSDHVGGFSLFVQGLWLEGRRRALPVHMPGGGVTAMKAWLEATVLPEELVGFPINWGPLAPAVNVREGDVTVTPHHTTHLESLRRAFQPRHPATCFEAFSFLIESAGLRIAHSADIGDVGDLDPLLTKPLDLLVCELAHVPAETLFARLRGRAIKKIVFVHLTREFWADHAGTHRMIASQLGDIPFTIAEDDDVFAV